MKTRPLITGALYAIVPAVAFVLLGQAVESGVVRAFDATVRPAVQSLRMPFLTALMRVITVSGNAVSIIALITVVTVGLWVSRRRALGLWAALTVFLGDRLTDLAKNAFARPRPEVVTALIAMPESLSYPSGHAAASLVTAGVLTYAAYAFPAPRGVVRAIGATAGVWALLVGVSRVYLGVHHPSDVVGGWLLGGAWLCVAVGAAVALIGPYSASQSVEDASQDA